MSFVLLMVLGDKPYCLFNGPWVAWVYMPPNAQLFSGLIISLQFRYLIQLDVLMFLCHFPEKNMLLDLPISVSTHSSQNDSQASLDNLLFQQLLNSSSICDQAHLLAVLHFSATSQLNTLPQPSLSLEFYSHDFVIALHLWLGISLFPLSHLCTCCSVINQFGDHLLGCSSKCITCHSVIYTIVK